MTQRMCLYFVPGNPEPAHQIHDVLPGHRSQYTLPHCSPTSPESVHYSHNVFMLATGNQYATSTMCSHWQSEASTLHPQCVHNGNPKPVHYIHSVFTMAIRSQYTTSTVCLQWQCEASTLHPQCVYNGNPKPVHYIHSVFTMAIRSQYTTSTVCSPGSLKPICHCAIARTQQLVQIQCPTHKAVSLRVLVVEIFKYHMW